MPFIMNKCFLLNPDKIWRKSVLTFSRKMHTLITKRTSPSQRLGYSKKAVNRLKDSLKLPETIVSRSLITDFLSVSSLTVY